MSTHASLSAEHNAKTGQLFLVTPKELDVVLDGIYQSQGTELAIISRTVSISRNPQEWPKWLRGQRVYQLRGDVPDLVERVVKLSKLHSLVLWSLDIGESGAQAIADRLTKLNSLALRSNRIGRAGVQAIAERLTRLTTLDVGRNKIGPGGAKAIAELLSSLTSLGVAENNIGDAGARAIANRLGNLSDLYIGNNNIGEIGALAIAHQLTKLTSLEIGWNPIEETGGRAIATQLSNLTSLEVGCTKIGEGGARAIAERLTDLTSLGIWDNNIGDGGAQAIAAHLTRLTALHVWNNNIGDLGAQAISERLTNLNSLNVSRNSVGENGAGAIAEHLTKLTSLYVSGNTGIHNAAPFARLTALCSLDLSDTSVSDLSLFSERIRAGWPVRIDYEWRDGVNVRKCPLETPPLEIVKQGPNAVRNYFIERERQSVVRLYEAKVLIVGEGGSGKTTLLRRLYRPDLPMPEEDETTRGIDIHRQDFEGNHNGSFRLNVWDFGGQQIYHATHQFFLTKSSLYVLVDDTRKDDKSIHDESFKFWFEVIETLTDKSPILIFQNEKGGRSKSLDVPGIKGRFPNVIEVYAGNLEDPQAAEALKQAIQFQVQQLPHVGTEVPAKWADIRREVEELSASRQYISQDEYFTIYARHLELDRTKALFLSRYLHDLGVFLHFQDDLLLKKTVILQDHWATDAVFRVLDDETTKKSLGRFTLADCSRLWHETRYADMHAELIGLMKKFELCYQLPETQPETWLAPQLLPPSKPAQFAGWAQPSDLVVRFRYPFLPRGLVSRLMVRQHRFARQLDWSWRHGAFLEQNGTAVLVEETLRGNEIEFRARGSERKELLSVIAGDLEALNHSFEGLRDKVDKLVPCLCEVCSKTTDPEMYRHKELIERRSRGKRTIECRREPYEDVEVLKLLDGIEPGYMPAWATEPVEADASKEKRFRVALSFAGENRPFVEQVAEHLSVALGRERVLYNKYFEEEFARPNLDTYLPRLYREESELIVVFLCSDYRKKRWCQLEWRHMKNLIATVDEGRIMLTRFEDLGDLSDIGILPGDGFIDIDDRDPPTIAKLILKRLEAPVAARRA